MPKRKQDSEDEGANSSSSDVDLVDVSFDFFDPNPKVDYQAIKRLLSQLFQRDAEQLHIHELTELILSQPTVGTTIKTDGIESDPYAILTVLNMHLHHQNLAMKAIADYLLSITSTHDPSFHATIQELFSQSDRHIGLVLCERLLNMPVQVIPPMYRMLADEMKWAVADSEPYVFSHLLIISRVYHLPEEEESALANASSTRRTRGQTSASGTNGKSVKKHKKTRSQEDGQRTGIPRQKDGIYNFHPEDEVIAEFAKCSLTYPYQSPLPSLVEETRSRDSFGLDTRGRLFLVEGSGERLRKIGEKMEEHFGAG